MPTLLISDIFPPRTGGSGRWFWEIYRRLPREDYGMVAGACPGDQAFDRQHDLRLERMPLAMRAWGVASPFALANYARLVGRIRKSMRRFSARHVHAARCLPEGWMAWLLRLSTGARYCVFVHGEDVEAAGTSRELSWMVRRVFGRAELLIANSHNTARILRESWKVPETQIQVLHPGVDTQRFVPAPRDPAVRNKLGWGTRSVVLTVGRLQERKGHDQMILALREIRRHVPDVLYAIAGEGEERLRLEGIVSREGLGEQVQFLGEIDDQQLIECYQQCDLFVLPNRTVGRDIEGFGMVLLEAQACGKPVIAGASGGTAETMRTPETGFTVCCDGPDALAALATELLSDPARRERMGRAGREWAVEHFDWASLAREAHRVFQQVEQRTLKPRAAAKSAEVPAEASARPVGTVSGSMGARQSADLSASMKG